MCISVYIIIDIDLFTYIVYIYIYTFVVYMFNMYIYIHLHIYLFLYLNMHMLFCERSCLFHFNSSFFPSLHPSIHPRAVKCDKHACMTDKYKKKLTWTLQGVPNGWERVPLSNPLGFKCDPLEVAGMCISIYICRYRDYLHICMRCSCTDHSHCWTVGLFYPYYPSSKPITPLCSGFAPIVEPPPPEKSCNDMFDDQNMDKRTQHRHIGPRSFTNKYGSKQTTSNTKTMVFLIYRVCYNTLDIQSYSQLMIGGSNHLLSIIFRFQYHAQKMIGCLGIPFFGWRPSFLFPALKLPRNETWQIGVQWLLMFHFLKPFEHLCPM